MNHEEHDGAPEAAPLLAGPADADREATGQIESSDRERRHIRGWLAGSFASEVYAVVSLTCYAPLALEAFARANGVLAPDYTTPCNHEPLEPAPPDAEPPRCVTTLLGLRIDTASFALYVYSISVALQALTVISIGAKVDTPLSRWRTFITASLVGSIATTLVLFLSESGSFWPLIALLVCSGNVGFGCCVVCLNSWLPNIARPVGDSKALARLSARGIALGYCSGVLLLVLSLIPVTLGHGSTLSLRIAVASSGLWWLVFTLVAVRWLPSTEGETTPSKSLADGWRALYAILGEASKLRDTSLFLAAWFLLSDAMSTITSVAILFGRTELGMPASRLVLVAVITPLSGVAGSLAWPSIARRLDNSLQSFTVLVFLALLLPAYGLLGLLPVFHGTDAPPIGGLRTEGELYALAVLFGAIYGPFQGYARATYAQLVPRDRAGRYFALWSITDKSSSFLGPLLVGIVVEWTGQIQGGFAVVAILLVLALPLLRQVDFEQGCRAASAQ